MVTPREIREAVQAFLALIEDGPTAGEENDEQLVLVLDQLALCSHFVSFEFEAEVDKEPPASSYELRREKVERRFPGLGYYNVADQVTSNIALSNCIVGDAIDDLADIAGDLMDVEWCWAHSSEADALWHFEFTYRNHWRQHLRSLQYYLESKEREDFHETAEQPT